MEAVLRLCLLCKKEMRSVMNDISGFWYWIFVGCETVGVGKIGSFQHSAHTKYKIQTTSLLALSARNR